MVEEQRAKWKLGPLSHIGIVVKDLDKAIEYYSSVFGLGPFSTDVYELKGFLYRGKPADARVKAAIAYSGRIFIELVQVLEGETAHTEFLREHGEGLQHIAFPVRDLDAALAELAKEGIKPIMHYGFTIEQPVRPDSDKSSDTTNRMFQVREAYLDSGETGGTVIQLMQFREIAS